MNEKGIKVVHELEPNVVLPPPYCPVVAIPVAQNPLLRDCPEFRILFQKASVHARIQRRTVLMDHEKNFDHVFADKLNDVRSKLCPQVKIRVALSSRTKPL